MYRIQQRLKNQQTFLEYQLNNIDNTSGVYIHIYSTSCIYVYIYIYIILYIYASVIRNTDCSVHVTSTFHSITHYTVHIIHSYIGLVQGVGSQYNIVYNIYKHACHT